LPYLLYAPPNCKLQSGLGAVYNFVSHVVEEKTSSRVREIVEELVVELPDSCLKLRQEHKQRQNRGDCWGSTSNLDSQFVHFAVRLVELEVNVFDVPRWCVEFESIEDAGGEFGFVLI